MTSTSTPSTDAAARPPVDEGFAPLLALLASPDVAAMTTMTPAEARASFRALHEMNGSPLEGVTVRDAVIDGPTGDLPVRIVLPDGEPRGVLVWFHGGGWVIGDLDTADDTTRRLAVGSGCVVVSVDYRLAPEHPAPAAADDCWAATRWTLDHLEVLGVPAGPVAVGGDSAGGNLAAVIAQRAAADGVRLAGQVLAYPVCDLAMDTASYRDNGEGYFLTADAMRWFGDHYLSGGADPAHPAVSPLRATDDALVSLAPAVVHVAGYDPLRDEGIAYAHRLRDVGVPVELVEYPSMIHGFYGMGALTPVAGEALAAAGTALRRLLDT